MLKQNPFSVYDFLGYFTPGAIFLYASLAVWAWLSPGSDFLPTLRDLWEFQRPQVLIPFVLVAYSAGHGLSFVSSVTVERYSIWTVGYPSRFLFGLKERESLRVRDVHWGSGDAGVTTLFFSRVRQGLRALVAVFLLPISLPEYLLGKVCGLRSVYARSIDARSRPLIERRIAGFLFYEMKVSTAEEGDWSRFEVFHFLYHWAVENAPNHFPKMQNYVALYGFLRTLTLICVMGFWVLIPLAAYAGVSCGMLLAVAACASGVAFACYLAFLKFFRRFSLEAIMAFTTCYKPYADGGQGVRSVSMSELDASG